MRVMQARRGRPLISTLQDPHFPALQFQRTARSPASRAWMRCRTSRTTMPGSTSTLYSTNPPPLASPRQTRKARSGIDPFQILDPGVGDGRQLARRLGTVDLLGLHSVLALADDHVDLQPFVPLLGIVDPSVRASALLARERRACYGLRGDQEGS